MKNQYPHFLPGPRGGGGGGGGVLANDWCIYRDMVLKWKLGQFVRMYLLPLSQTTSVVRFLDFHNRSSKIIVQEFSTDDRL